METGMIAVVLGPAGQQSEMLASAVAPIIKKAFYETVLLLGSKIPRIACRLPDKSSAEKVAAKICSLGLAAFIIPEHELNLPAHYFRASRVIFEDDCIRFEDRAGKEKTLTPAEIFLVLKGRQIKQSQTEIRTTRRRLNITGTLITGGIPVMKKETRTTREVSTESAVFLRIFSRASIDPEIELLQHDLDYSFLGKEMTAAVQGNFNLLVRKLREKFPAAIYDDSLMESGRPGLSKLVPDISIVDSRLIYLNHLHKTG